ncbi:Arrestin or S-antigen, domain-containing protein [Cladophialophora immunda]|nr:Arrestin or S-antigen, domain-containing protein [Cladophialophora immunda]
MLTVHDPEKALASLASPLLATDTLYLAREPDIQTVKLTAGLHRQTWVNGALIFIDVHVANNTSKTVKKIEAQLEKTTLWYTHAPAGTAEKSANYLRLPKRTDAEVVSGTTLKKSNTWKGVPSHSSDVRTIELEAPRGHVTISTGRYFEVRYFVNVVVTVKMFKTVAVQLPVTIIPINSLDILPNSLAQVAASIEAKRSKTVPAPPPGPSLAAHHQGQAFTAPVRQSAERVRQERPVPQEDLDSLANDVDKSPRRLAHTHSHCRGGLSGTTTDENVAPGRPSMASSSHHHLQRHPSCYHCQITSENCSPPKPVGPRLPRLQVSTSGLGFSESEFEIPPDSPPRKVMLSEHERNMINRQRELQNRQQRSQWAQKRPSGDNKRGEDLRISKNQPCYTNVVADPNAGPKQGDFGNLSPGVRKRGDGMAFQKPMLSSNGLAVARSRSKTNPEGPRYRPSISKPRRRSSTDRHDRARASVDGPAFPAMPRRFSKDLAQRASLDQLF